VTPSPDAGSAAAVGTIGSPEATDRPVERRRPRRLDGFTTGRRIEEVDLAVVIPMYRESTRIDATIATLAASGLAGSGVRIVFVDDGSDDGTAVQVARSLGRHGLSNASLLAATVNRGKGATIRLGVEHALEELDAHHVVYLDADLSLDPDIVVTALDHLRETGLDAVVGVRRFERSHQPISRRVASTLFRLTARTIAPTGVSDTQCACKVFTARAARLGFADLRTPGYAFDVEVLLRWRRAGLRIGQMPVVWRHQSGSKIATARHAREMLGELVAIRRAVRR
jgi:dolichyl-phosphate beta-glucosyltransferase